TTVAASQDGNLVVTGAGSVARSWEVATGRPGPTFSPPGKLDAMALSPDGRIVLLADRPPTGDGFDTTIRLWDARTGQRRDTTYPCKGRVLALALSPDGQTLLAAEQSGDGKLWSWDVATGQSLGSLAVPRGTYRALAYSPDGRGLLTGGDDHMARLWDPRTGG